MKTVHVNDQGVVINVSVGEPSSDAPAGTAYVAVADDLYVGAGFTYADGEFVAPPSDDPIV